MKAPSCVETIPISIGLEPQLLISKAIYKGVYPNLKLVVAHLVVVGV